MSIRMDAHPQRTRTNDLTRGEGRVGILCGRWGSARERSGTVHRRGDPGFPLGSRGASSTVDGPLASESRGWVVSLYPLTPKGKVPQTPTTWWEDSGRYGRYGSRWGSEFRPGGGFGMGRLGREVRRRGSIRRIPEETRGRGREGVCEAQRHTCSSSIHGTSMMVTEEKHPGNVDRRCRPEEPIHRPPPQSGRRALPPPSHASPVWFQPPWLHHSSHNPLQASQVPLLPPLYHRPWRPDPLNPIDNPSRSTSLGGRAGGKSRG